MRSNGFLPNVSINCPLYDLKKIAKSPLIVANDACKNMKFDAVRSPLADKMAFTTTLPVNEPNMPCKVTTIQITQIILNCSAFNLESDD